MCRHLAYLGAELSLSTLLDVPQGLYEQSWAPRLQRYGTVNADGFGFGWYPPASTAASAANSVSASDSVSAGDPASAAAVPRPARYRRAVPIWADQNLPDLARTIRSTAVLAAVRDATPGTSQDEAAAAPFAYDRWLFSHNGAIPDWPTLAEDLEVPLLTSELATLEARCDSVLLWLLIHRRLAAGEGAAEVLADVALRTAAVRPGARLNLLLTDGETITAVRHGDTLWYRTTTADERGATGATGVGGGVVVAAEPDSVEGWQEVPDGCLLLASAAQATQATGANPAEAAQGRQVIRAAKGTQVTEAQGARAGPGPTVRTGAVSVRTLPLESVLTSERTPAV